MLARFAILRLQLLEEANLGSCGACGGRRCSCNPGPRFYCNSDRSGVHGAAAIFRLSKKLAVEFGFVGGSDVAHAVTDSAERAPGGRTHVSPQSRTRLESKKLMFDH